MKLKHWQIIWELISYVAAGALLVINIAAPSFKHIAWFLVAEYLISIVNTIGWWKWVNAVDSKNDD